MPHSHTGGNERSEVLTALLLVFLIILVYFFWHSYRGKTADKSREGLRNPSVYAEVNKLYSTADVDPMVTGELYQYADNVRDVYTQRSAHGPGWGLTEYSSSGGPGEVGVDVGPYGLEEYGGQQVGYNDGIPEAWAFPSTPIRWYAPRQRDYYGPEGPTVYSEGLHSLTVPDHDPLVN